MPLLDAYIQNPELPNGIYRGGIAREIESLQFDTGMRRPFLDKFDRPCLIMNTGRWTLEKGERKPLREKVRVKDLLNRGVITPETLTANATSLRKEDWIEMDRVMLTVARSRLRAWADLAAANTYGGFNGMAKMTLEYEAMSDPGEAIVDMEGDTEGRTDSPLFKLRSIPLPIIHSNFWFSKRRLDISRNSTALDTTMLEACTRRCAEMLEKTTLGISGGFSGLDYGGQTSGYGTHDTSSPDDAHGSALTASTVYGYTTYPHRLTKTDFTTPTSGGFVADTTYNEILTALNTMHNQNFHGPWIIYHSTDWSTYMNRAYSVAGGNHPGETLRTMLLKHEDISDVRRLDFLTSTFTLIFVQMTSDVARAIIGMPFTTVQWPSMGGMRENFKVMTIQVPQIRSDYKGQCGIMHGTTA